MTWLDAVAQRIPDTADLSLHEQDRRQLLRLVGQLREAVHRARTGCLVNNPAPNCGCLGCALDAALAACDAETPPTEGKEPPR